MSSFGRTAASVWWSLVVCPGCCSGHTEAGTVVSVWPVPGQSVWHLLKDPASEPTHRPPLSCCFSSWSGFTQPPPQHKHSGYFSCHDWRNNAPEAWITSFIILLKFLKLLALERCQQWHTIQSFYSVALTSLLVGLCAGIVVCVSVYFSLPTECGL